MLLFLSGLLILFYPHVAQYINNQSATNLVAAYREAMSADPGSFEDGKGSLFVAESGEEVFGSISIPKLHLELPIFVGATSSNLEKGIAHLEGTSLPIGGASTHSVLAGHNGAVTNEWFTNIDRLEPGDRFSIRNGNSVLDYTVLSSKIISPTDTSDLVIEQGRDLVTLLTCTDNGVERLLVKGERIA